MKSHSFSGPERPVTKRDLDKVEKRFNFSFPQALRNHYLRINGGSPERCLFPKDDDYCVVHEFLPIKLGEDTLEETLQDLVIERHVIPGYLVPFAIDPGGDFYCFSIRKKDFGAIFLFVGDYFDDLDEAVVHLAKSFPVFMRQMKTEEEVPEPPPAQPPPAQHPPRRPPRRKRKPRSAGEKKAILEAALRVLKETGQKMNLSELLEAMAAKGYLAERPTEDTRMALYDALWAEISRGERARNSGRPANTRVKLCAGGRFALSGKG